MQKSNLKATIPFQLLEGHRESYSNAAHVTISSGKKVTKTLKIRILKCYHGQRALQGNIL